MQLSFTCCSGWSLNWSSTGSFLIDVNITQYPFPHHCCLPQGAGQAVPPGQTHWINHHLQGPKASQDTEMTTGLQQERMAGLLKHCSSALGTCLCHKLLFTRAIWVTFWLPNVSDRCHLDVCFCNSCCGCSLPLGNALTYEIRFSKPEPTNLKFWVSRFCQSYSPCASVLKTGATHLCLREVLWKWTNPKYMPAPVLTATGKSIWKWPSEIYYNIQPEMPTATHRAAKIELNVDCVVCSFQGLCSYCSLNKAKSLWKE